MVVECVCLRTIDPIDLGFKMFILHAKRLFGNSYLSGPFELVVYYFCRPPARLQQVWFNEETKHTSFQFHTPPTQVVLSTR